MKIKQKWDEKQLSIKKTFISKTELKRFKKNIVDKIMTKHKL